AKPPTKTYSLSLHDALPIFQALKKHRTQMRWAAITAGLLTLAAIVAGVAMFSRNRVGPTLSVPEKSIAVLPFENRSEDKANAYLDRKSTRLNSSHSQISYAV